MQSGRVVSCSVRKWVSVAAFVATSAPAAAFAAGWDTPILYTARHQGMGGTAIGYVNDPSAAFHNPAGLQGVKGVELLGNFSLILAEIRSTPNQQQAESIDSNTVVAPFPFLTAAYRMQEWFTLGVGAYPVASGAAEYEYDNILGNPTIDKTQVLFIEGTVLGSLNVPEDKLLPGKLSIGAGWRMTRVSLDREQGNPDDPRGLNLDLTGWDFSGVRIGLQYKPIPQLSFGAVWRSKVDVDADGDTGVFIGQNVNDPTVEFILPQRFGFGARYDLDRFGFAVDYEWADQSQNGRVNLEGTFEGAANPTVLQQIYDWQDGSTLRAGVEYRIPANSDYVPVRVGYLYDSRVTNPAFPSAFGTPPTATNSITLGAGYVSEDWQVNLAGAYRFGSTTVEPGEVSSECRASPLCAGDGDYRIRAVGMYIDGSVRFDVAGLDGQHVR